MTIPMYQASAPVFLKGLANMKGVLAKGAPRTRRPGRSPTRCS